MQIRCPHCSRELRVPDELQGKQVRCKFCKRAFVAAASAAQHDLTWRVQTAEGEQYGPVTKTELDQWVAEARLDCECQVLRQDWNQWQWADDVYPELKSSTPAPTTAASPAAPAVKPGSAQAAPSAKGAAPLSGKPAQSDPRQAAQRPADSPTPATPVSSGNGDSQTKSPMKGLEGLAAIVSEKKPAGAANIQLNLAAKSATSKSATSKSAAVQRRPETIHHPATGGGRRRPQIEPLLHPQRNQRGDGWRGAFGRVCDGAAKNPAMGCFSDGDFLDYARGLAACEPGLRHRVWKRFAGHVRDGTAGHPHQRDSRVS